MLEIGLLSAGSLILSIVALAGIGLVSWLVYARPGAVFQAVFLATSLVSILSIALSGRVLHFSETGLQVYSDTEGGGTVVGKGLLLILAGASLSVCMAWWLLQMKRPRPPARYTGNAGNQISQLTWSFVLYFVAFSLLPLAFADKYEFHVSLIYPLFIWLALLLSLRISTIDPVVALRRGLALIIIGSLAAAVFMPELALQPGYRSLLPGFSMRLWGFTAHANALGSVAATLIVLQFAEKARPLFRHQVITMAAIVTLLLTQSKTAIAGTLLGIFTLAVWRIWHGRHSNDRSNANSLPGITTLIFAASLLLATFWVVGSTPGSWTSVLRALDQRAVDTLSTLSGRTEIWEYAIRRGMEHPFFGNGLAMWDAQTRIATGMSGAVHAHNLFLQAFSRSGFIGLFALFVLLWHIARNAFRAARTTRGGSLALLGMFLLRTITEVPLQPNSILGAEFFAFVAMLVFTADRAFRPPPAQERQTAPSRTPTYSKAASGSGALSRANVAIARSQLQASTSSRSQSPSGTLAATGNGTVAVQSAYSADNINSAPPD